MSELEDILNYLETTSLEPHDDYVSEFSYKKQKTLWKYIKDLRLENQELKNQQKEFIDWLEKMINNLDNDINKINGISENSKREKERATIKYNILIQIIKKYKEMIGDK